LSSFFKLLSDSRTRWYSLLCWAAYYIPKKQWVLEPYPRCTLKDLHVPCNRTETLDKQFGKSIRTCFLTISIFSSLLSKSKIMKKVRFKINDKNKVNPVRYLIEWVDLGKYNKGIVNKTRIYKSLQCSIA
jgi:hypothetical protein